MKRLEYTQELFKELVLPANMRDARAALKTYCEARGYVVQLNPRPLGLCMDAIISNDEERILIKIGGLRPKRRRVEELQKVNGYYRVYLIRNSEFFGKFTGYVCTVGVKTPIDESPDLVYDDEGFAASI